MRSKAAVFPRIKDAREFKRAFHAHEHSKRELEKAQADIERFTECLYGALKFREEIVERYGVTAIRLRKAKGQ
jgi:hypothetical protein